MGGGCVLVGSFFSFFVQVLLAFFCVALLCWKRLNERPRRSGYVFFLDTSKQGFGSALGHIANLCLSKKFSEAVPGGADACQWYFLNFIADSTMGTIFNVLALGIYEHVATTLRFPQLGDYGSPPDLFIWSFQLFVFLSIIAINKGLLVLLFSAYKYDLDAFISGAFTSLQAHPELELVLVMIVIPLCCNSISFWVTDTFLKQKALVLREATGDDGRGDSVALMDGVTSSSSTPQYSRIRNMYDAADDADDDDDGGTGKNRRFLPAWLRDKLNRSPTSPLSRTDLDGEKVADDDDWGL